MYLKCTLCGERFYLAKYYPSTGWYTNVGAGDATMADMTDAQRAAIWFKEFAAFLDQHSPSVRRDELGHYAEPGNGQHVRHGAWAPSRQFDIVHLGKVFGLEYE